MDEPQCTTYDLPMDDSELRAALEQHHAMSYGWAVSCCAADATDAEDILQSAYRKILEGKARYQGRASFKTWLFAVIRNTAASERRRNWLRHLRLGAYGQEHKHDSQPADHGRQLDQTDRLEVFRQALEALPARQREILHLVFYQNLTIEESARAMSVSIGSARTHYDRAKKRMAELLKNSGKFE